MKTYLQLLVVLSAGYARAQSLEAFLESAKTRNVDARLSAAATSRAEADYGQSWGGLLPSLTASGGWTHNQYEAKVEIPTGVNTSDTIIITPKDQLDTSLKVEVSVIDLSKWFRTSASAANLTAAEAREHATSEQVQRQVINGYYAYLAAIAVKSSAEKSLGFSQSQADFSEARTKAGVANELDHARAQAEVERNRQLVADAEALVANAARTLRTLSGVEPQNVPALPDDDLHPEPALTQLEPGVDQLAQVKAAERDALSSRRTSTAATLALVPSVNAQFTQRFTNATGFQGQGALYNAGVTFNWRLDVPAAYALKAQAAAELTATLNAEKARATANDQLHADW